MCRTRCERNSAKSSLTRSLPQLPAAEVSTQSASWDQNESKQQKEKLTFSASNHVKVAPPHSCSYSSGLSGNRKYHSCRRGGNDAGDVRKISQTSIRTIGKGKSHRNVGATTSNVGIGATVVMAFLATINVIIYLPAAAVELVCLMVENEVLDSLARFLFDNLCFAHAFNVFVYVLRLVLNHYFYEKIRIVLI